MSILFRTYFPENMFAILNEVCYDGLMKTNNRFEYVKEIVYD